MEEAKTEFWARGVEVKEGVSESRRVVVYEFVGSRIPSLSSRHSALQVLAAALLSVLSCI